VRWNNLCTLNLVYDTRIGKMLVNRLQSIITAKWVVMFENMSTWLNFLSRNSSVLHCRCSALAHHHSCNQNSLPGGVGIESGCLIFSG